MELIVLGVEIRFPNKEKLNKWVKMLKANNVLIQEGKDTFNGVPVIVDPYLPENKGMMITDSGEVKVFEI